MKYPLSGKHVRVYVAYEQMDYYLYTHGDNGSVMIGYTFHGSNLSLLAQVAVKVGLLLVLALYLFLIV